MRGRLFKMNTFAPPKNRKFAVFSRYTGERRTRSRSFLWERGRRGQAASAADATGESAANTFSSSASMVGSMRSM